MKEKLHRQIITQAYDTRIMIFEITKPITATLRVECNSEEEAKNWADKIVATIEDENGKSISSNEVEYFEAETVISQIKITKK